MTTLFSMNDLAYAITNSYRRRRVMFLLANSQACRGSISLLKYFVALQDFWQFQQSKAFFYMIQTEMVPEITRYFNIFQTPTIICLLPEQLSSVTAPMTRYEGVQPERMAVWMNALINCWTKNAIKFVPGIDPLFPVKYWAAGLSDRLSSGRVSFFNTSPYWDDRAMSERAARGGSEVVIPLAVSLSNYRKLGEPSLML